MRFRLGLIVGVLIGIAVSAATIYAVNVTFVLTQGEVDVATWKWNQVDPNHASFATVQLFGTDALRTLLGGWKGQRAIARINLVGAPNGYFCTNTWSGLSQGAKDTICTTAPASGGLGEL